MTRLLRLSLADLNGHCDRAAAQARALRDKRARVVVSKASIEAMQDAIAYKDSSWWAYLLLVNELFDRIKRADRARSRK